MERLNGVLKEIGKPVTTNGKPVSFTVDPSGQYLYVLNENEKGLLKYKIDKLTGLLSEAEKIKLPYAPTALDISREFH